jgi:hypothetical protein
MGKMSDMMDIWLGIATPKESDTDNNSFAFLKDKRRDFEPMNIVNTLPKRGYVNGKKQTTVPHSNPVDTFWSKYEKPIVKKIVLKERYQSHYERAKTENDYIKHEQENKANPHKIDIKKVKHFNSTTVIYNQTKI